MIVSIKVFVTSSVPQLFAEGDRKIELGERGFAMDICLHLGAHRTGTTTFQRFMTGNGFAGANGSDGIAFWGPMRTRRGLFSGLVRNPERVKAADLSVAQRSCGRIKMEISRLAGRGVTDLVISDENMIGAIGQNLAAERLYSQIRARLAAFAPALGGNNLRLMLSIRSYHSYWASSLAYRIKAGHGSPNEETLDRLVTQPRRWRDVIYDIGVTFPEAQITVMPFEGVIGDTQDQFEAVLGRQWPAKLRDPGHVCNASPKLSELANILCDRDDHSGAEALEGIHDRYMPFNALHIQKMRADYDEDIAWLLDGADGRARYLNPVGETSDDTEIGTYDIEGTPNDKRKERLDRARRERAARAATG